MSKGLEKKENEWTMEEIGSNLYPYKYTYILGVLSCVRKLK